MLQLSDSFMEMSLDDGAALGLRLLVFCGRDPNKAGGVLLTEEPLGVRPSVADLYLFCRMTGDRGGPTSSGGADSGRGV